MNIETGCIKNLLDKDDRTTAKLARIATNNTVFGGCSAMVMANRLDAMGGHIDASGVVSNVYAASIGRALPEYRVCCCPECGCTVLGEDTALQCCQEEY
jgi:hypothetical protein